ncbi:Low affinity immunoglobulin epsilon Fc receptor [Halotydeus destructor]|nr:Low affinity immunoglobulin epsilon Fc receptor [Halotydeus destructor]
MTCNSVGPFLLLTALAGARVYATADDDPFCPTGFVQFEHFCYFYNREPLSYAEATHRCENHFFGQLVSIHSQDEQKFLTTYLFKTLRVNQNIWLGGQRDPDTKPATIGWSDGSPLNYTNWMPGEPNYDRDATSTHAANCVLMWSMFDNRGKWSITNCHFVFGSLCKRPLVEPPEVTASPGQVIKGKSRPS